jgi:hypothetical protein
MISKCVYILLFYLNISQGFIFNPIANKLLPNTKHMIALRAHNNTLNSNITKSKVFKMDYRSNEEKEYEEFFSPKYLFNLSEFHMTFIRIYIYMVITIYFITIYLENIFHKDL